MKKKFAVAMAITAGLCFAGSGQVKPAFAGYWEMTVNPDLDQYGMAPPPFDPSYPHYLVEDAKRVDGSVGIFPNYTDNWHEGYPALNGGFEGQPIFASTTPGNTLIVSSIGKRKLLFHWVQNQINGQDDPNDNPPAQLHIEVYAQAAATLDNINSV